jgi:hypothetical protein
MHRCQDAFWPLAKRPDTYSCLFALDGIIDCLTNCVFKSDAIHASTSQHNKQGRDATAWLISL